MNTQTPPVPAWDEYVTDVARRFRDLIDTAEGEREVQNFLELHPSLVPGGAGDVGPGGHHGSQGSVLFAEPRLKGVGRDFEPDFMWVTRSTASVTPILIEIEDPTKLWFNMNHTPTAELTQALSQINDWRTWLSEPENQSIFRKEFLFEDKYANRPLRPHFLLIYGRAREFEPGVRHKDPDALRKKRDGLATERTSFMTFDSLRPVYEVQSTMTVTNRAGGMEVRAFSPHYEVDKFDLPALHLRFAQIDDALARSELAPERKEAIAAQWAAWREAARRGN